MALRRCGDLLERLDDPRLTPSRGPRAPPPPARGDHPAVADLRPAPGRSGAARRGAHGDGLLRRHALHGRAPPLPGRSMAPSTCRCARAAGPAADTGRTGTRPPRVRPFLRWGSWIGGDRDGNPDVTAEITERTLRIQADHVLRGYEAVATRLMQTVAAASTEERTARSARVASRPRRRGPARDRPAAPPSLPGRAVPPALRVHRRAAASDAGGADRRGGAAERPVRQPGRSRGGARRDPGGARRRRPRTGRLGRGGRPPLAGRDVRVPPGVARDPSARGRPRAPRSRRSRDGRARPPRRSRRGSAWTRCWPRSGRSPRSRRGSARTPAGATSSASRPRRRTLTDVLALAGHAVADGGRPVAPPELDVVPAVRIERGPAGRRADPAPTCSTTRRTAPGSRRAAIARR